ncbi:hypothetical protein OF83DRAFT_1160084 [Amylostereum chailletii]|nr:hypothetical protein OF83DRAFT_1160084 [Amylostereum chailletii]
MQHTLIRPDTRIKSVRILAFPATSSDPFPFRVSSTLDKSVGKKFLTDRNPDTCWTSQQGLPQFIQLLYTSPVIPRRLILTFQGGFVGTRCSVEYQPPGSSEWLALTDIYPEDVNRKQAFAIDSSPASPSQALRLSFLESSDFFGRVTVYDLDIEVARSLTLPLNPPNYREIAWHLLHHTILQSC